MDEITLGHELEDAFLLKGLRPGLTLILYNKEKYGPRMKPNFHALGLIHHNIHRKNTLFWEDISHQCNLQIAFVQCHRTQ